MMTLVNAETGEVVAACTPDEARRLTDEIRGAAEQVWSLLVEAHDRQAWAALGYESFSDYATAEFGMSKVHAYRLLGQGEVIREIESATGVTRGLLDVSERAAREIKPRLKAVTDAIKKQVTAEAVIEPERVKEIVAEVVAEERDKAKQDAEDRAALASLNAKAQDVGMETDPRVAAERGAFARLCTDLAKQGDPADFATRHNGWLNERRIGLAEKAYEWLDTFLLEAREGK